MTTIDLIALARQRYLASARTRRDEVRYRREVESLRLRREAAPRWSIRGRRSQRRRGRHLT